MSSVSRARVHGTAVAIRELHDYSGLTWEQIAKLFGVSRRAVHLWASGGRLSAANEELLLRITGLVRSISDAGQLEIRQKIVAEFDESRRSRSSNEDDINRPALTWRSQAGISEED